MLDAVEVPKTRNCPQEVMFFWERQGLGRPQGGTGLEAQRKAGGSQSRLVGVQSKGRDCFSLTSGEVTRKPDKEKEPASEDLVRGLSP